MTIGIATMSIIGTSMVRTRLPESRTRTGTGIHRWCIGIRIIPTCIIGTATATRSEEYRFSCETPLNIQHEESLRRRGHRCDVPAYIRRTRTSR
jgi:hypothetical protein